MLNLLPPEILGIIAYQLPRKRDLAQLCKVSKQGHSLTMPILYETVEIAEDRELRQPNPGYWRIYQNLHDYPHNRDLVKNIHVTRSMHDSGCFHSFDEDTIYQRTLWLRYARFGGSVGRSVLDFLQLFDDNSLRGFHWELGTCIPKEILGVEGYITLKQTKLSSLSVIRDIACGLRNIRQQPEITLYNFCRLKSLSWCTDMTRIGFIDLRNGLQTNQQYLENLNLDLGDWYVLNNPNVSGIEWPKKWSQHFFADGIMTQCNGNIQFPELRSLSLTGLSFYTMASKLAASFNVTNLRILNLRHCLQARKLLETIVASRQTMQLKSFEIELGDCGEVEYAIKPLVSFLSSFQGLQKLYIFIREGESNHAGSRLLEAVHHHRQTLKELIFEDIAPGRYYTPWNDKQPGAFYKHLSLPPFELEHIGLCCSLANLRYHITAVASAPTLQTMHIRRSLPTLHANLSGYTPMPLYAGPILDDDGETADLRSFAHWAFASRKYPKLKVLAYGDFTPRGRRLWRNLVIFKAPIAGGSGLGARLMMVRMRACDGWDFLEGYGIERQTVESLRVCLVEDERLTFEE